MKSTHDSSHPDLSIDLEDEDEHEQHGLGNSLSSSSVPPPSPSPRLASRPFPIRRFNSTDGNNIPLSTAVSVKKYNNNVDSCNENTLHSLHQAARDGDVRVMRYLLDGIGSNFIRRKINQLDEDELGPLHYAARYNFCDMVKLLVDKGANVDIRAGGGLTPLHFAARYKKMKSAKRRSREEVVKSDPLSNRIKSNQESNKINTRFRSFTSQTLFQKRSPSSRSLHSDPHDAIENLFAKDGTICDVSGFHSVVLFLAALGAQVNSKDNTGQTPLHHAAMRGNEGAVRELLQCKDINIEARDNQNMTALHLVAIHGNVEIASLLMEADADIRSRDKNHATPLHKAAMEGHLAIVILLLKTAEKRKGVTSVIQMVSDQDNDLDTALHLAVDNGHREIVKLLIDQGADVNIPRHNFLYPLHLAAVSGDLEIVKLLMADNNARIDCVNRVQETPLYRAAEYNQVDVIDYLVLNGAMIDRRDKDNFTPLLIAACEGQVAAIQSLLKHGADASAVDKSDKTAIYWAAEENHFDALVVLLQDPTVKELINRGDRHGNSPLHVAAKKGFLGILQYLLDQGAQIDVKNEDGQTPLHFAAKYGRTRVVRELVRRNKPIVNDEDEDCNNPLHLAALAGHDRAVQVLLTAGADSNARNSHQWTALDCAAVKGWVPTVSVLVGQRDSPIDPHDKFQTTSLHLAASKGHTEVVQLLLQSGAKVSRLDDQGRNCLELAVENSHKSVAMLIIQSDEWQDALRNETINPKTNMRDTPMRKLIRNLPEVAEKVFFRCTTTNRVPVEHPSFAVTFNYEFLDDMYASFQDTTAADPTAEPINGSKSCIYDEDNKVRASASLYSEDASILKDNHPLMIMVSSRRRKLLSHPLCMSLVELKWHDFGRHIYYSNLMFYVLFVTFLTGYILNQAIPEQDELHSMESTSSYNITNDSSEMEEILRRCSAITVKMEEENNSIFARVLFVVLGKYVILVLTIINFGRECFQFYQVRLSYFNLENLLEWTCYVTSLLLVLDFTECSTLTGVRESWQWQMASITLFLAWVNLMLFVRKLPFLGIYVVMFTYVFSTFVKAFSVLWLIIVAFGLGLHTILYNHEVFETPGKSIVRVLTMMLGEFEFDGLFEESHLAFPIPSYILFTVLMMLTYMILLNLLAGLAVDQIKEIQEQAELRRLAMQVELVLNVERVLPQFLHRRFVLKEHTVLPNQRKRAFLRKFLDKMAYFKMTNIASLYSEKNEKTDLERLQENQEILLDNLSIVHHNARQVEIQNQRLESLLMTLISHKGLQWEDEDEKKHHFKRLP